MPTHDLPTNVTAIVLDRTGALHGEVAELLQQVDGADVRVSECSEVPMSARELDRLIAGRVDHLLVVGRGSDRLATDVAAALEVMRGDPTVGVVGASVTRLPHGSLELAVSQDLMLIRVGALQELGGLPRTSSGGLDDLGLGLHMWLQGFRVRSIDVGGAELAIQGLSASDRSTALSRVAHMDIELTGGGSARRGWPELEARLREWGRSWSKCSELGDELLAMVAAEPARGPHRVLVVTTDVLAERMAGPAIRALSIARVLSSEHEVVLVSTQHCDLSVPGLVVELAGEGALRRWVEWADVIVFQGWVMAGRRWLRDSHKIIVCDLYDPMHLEQLEQGREASGDLGRVDAVRGAAAVLNEQMERADFMVCASEKQRDLWIGALAAIGRVNPVVYDDDPSLRRLIDVAPFGVEEEPPPVDPTGGAIRGVIPGIGREDMVILWGGGVYNWFDPLTLIRAVGQLRRTVPQVRLFFLGMGHPNPSIPTMRMAVQARDLARSLGLIGTHVFFNEGWVPYSERWRYLADADVGVSTHFDHVETAYSFRTRILDYLWAGLPVVATSGDSLASLIEQHGAGVTVAPEDVDALAEALGLILTDEDRAAAARVGSRRLGEELRWSSALHPLVEFCRSPKRAADIACPTLVVTPDPEQLARGWRRDLQVALQYLRAGGPVVLARRVRQRLRELGDR